MGTTLTTKNKRTMAKKTDTEGRPPSARRSRAARAEENAYVEQISELLLVHNKDDPGHGVRAVSKAHGDGKCETVPATEENENSFLKFDKNSSIIENFIRNFWSQLKEPTHFRLLRMTVNDYRRNKQAIRDLAEGKRTDTVREFLKRYEIRPRKETRKETVNQNQEKEMAKKQQLQPEQQTEVQQAAQGMEQQPAQEQQGPAYRYNEDMVDWNALKKVGVSKELLENMGVLDGMLRGYKTNRTIPLTLNIEGVMTAKIDARLSFLPSDGQVVLGVHGIRKEPELSRPYFGHNFTEEEKKNLRESGNLGHAVDLKLRGDNYTPCLVSIDKITNELVAVRQEHVYIPDEVKGVRLDPDEITRLKNGEAVFVDGMVSAKGKEFSATLQYSAERRGLEFIFPKDNLLNQQTIGGVKLTQDEVKRLSEGHTVLVEGMKRNNGDTFSAFVTIDQVTGRPQYTRCNPETGEIYIPNEICKTALTAEDRETLRKGGVVFLENMINRRGEEFSSFVRLDMTTGTPPILAHPRRFRRKAGAEDTHRSVRPRLHGRGTCAPAGRQGHTRGRHERPWRQGVLVLHKGEPEHWHAQLLPGRPRQAAQHAPQRTGGGGTRECAGTEERSQAGRMTKIQAKQKRNIQMEQRQTKAFNADVLDWTRLGNMGIDRQALEASGGLGRLLDGEETGVMTLRLRTGLMDITTDATLQIITDSKGRPVLQVKGVDKEKM